MVAHPEAGRVSQIQTIRDLYQVTFSDGHQSVFTSDAFDAVQDSLKTDLLRIGVVEERLWQASIADDPPRVHYDSIEAGPGMAHLMMLLRVYGFCSVVHTPPTSEATQALLEGIGPIRNTHYGGFYDFTADLSSKDTAYTSESLEPHTDNTYFTEPAGLQALHMLSHTDGSGGKSSLVDGFKAAQILRETDPEAYRILSTTGVYAHASGNQGISIQPASPAPTLSHDKYVDRLMQVRWNNADRAGVAAQIGEEMEAWYRAAAKWDAILSDLHNQYWFQLKPGTLLLFDNWRVLHGRSAFTGKRRMCGGYINRDDFISRFRTTNLTKADLEASTVTG
ncbi:hypothetical protein B0A48_06655 [Cryoendolithus antarcticus]|uniref:TauD/TfdA-like domain-containing protein n=1 Tax=Cryoendolithus antarcticus TaxID=1507870 RepID=A0A1V8T9A9_9PEZI|nr:hypothetical protein B0A48_06655 [Cryoendolithus antarcticus]